MPATYEDACDELQSQLDADNAIGRMLRRQPVTDHDCECVRRSLCRTLKAFRVAKRHADSLEQPRDVSDATLSRHARLTDALALKPYARLLHLVPRIVNVVTLAEVVKVDDDQPASLHHCDKSKEAVGVSGGTNRDHTVQSASTTPLLDLMHIATRCSSAYYAPKRFAAVQLAYDNPRARVLIFHTGRLVGTGARGPMAARLAIMKAQRQLAEEANVHVRITKFEVINSVGAVSLDATLNCDAFASAHSSTSHFDRDSFVGLAWRPPGEAICCEVYSTGRANLPGAVTERALVRSFSRMLGELSRFTNQPQIADMLPEELRNLHRSTGDCVTPAGARTVRADLATAKSAKRKSSRSVKTEAAVKSQLLTPAAVAAQSFRKIVVRKRRRGATGRANEDDGDDGDNDIDTSYDHDYDNSDHDENDGDDKTCMSGIDDLWAGWAEASTFS